MMKKERVRREFKSIPVSKQGQITLPKIVREKLGITLEKRSVINIILNSDDSIVIEAQPSVDEVYGILNKYTTGLEPVNMYKLREDFSNERIKELGY